MMKMAGSVLLPDDSFTIIPAGENRKVSHRSPYPRITIHRGGKVAINRNAFEVLGRPKYVQVVFSRAKEIIRIVALTENQARESVNSLLIHLFNNAQPHRNGGYFQTPHLAPYTDVYVTNEKGFNFFPTYVPHGTKGIIEAKLQVQPQADGRPVIED